MDGVARYRPEHDLKKLMWARLFPNVCLPSIRNLIEYAALKFVFN